VGDTSVCVDQVRIIRDDGVTTVLGDDTDDNGKPPAVTLGPEEVQVAGCLINLLLYPKSFSDFTILELDGQVVLVTVSVPFGQGLEGLFVAVLRYKPSRRLGDDLGKWSAKWHQDWSGTYTR
jgi:hypothetical protein